MGHFEIWILKLIWKFISRKLVDQLNSNFVLLLSLWSTIHINQKIVTINTVISKFNKTQSQCPLRCSRITRASTKQRTFAHTYRTPVLLQAIIGFWCSVWCWKLPHAVVRRTLSRGMCRDSYGHGCADCARCYSFPAGRWDLRLSCRETSSYVKLF